ncbi:MAG: DUF3592 domain-containing protein [Pseudomonadota bacterium]
MGRLVGTLFAAPFCAFGLGMLLWIGNAWLDAQAMQRWLPSEAIILDGGYRTNSSSDGGATYKAWAKYRYTIGGVDYTSERVAISDTADNIGDFHRELGGRLSDAAASGDPVTAWVNPDKPAEAVLDRSFRWGLQLFKLAFGVVFLAVGIIAAYATWSTRKPESKIAADLGSKPWLANPAWDGAALKSEAKKQLKAGWFFAGFWNLVSMPLPFLLIDEVTNKGNYLALVGLLFPIVGIGLLVWAIRMSREWRRFGAALCELDPFPGAIGGNVGGVVRITGLTDAEQRFDVTLSSVYSQRGSKSRTERVQWQHSQRLSAVRASDHHTVTFRFDVPGDLPESEPKPDGGNYHLWRLHIHGEMAGPDFDRTYELPVFATGATSEQLAEGPLANDAREQSANADAAVEQRFRLHRGGLYPEIEFPAGRHATMSLFGLLFGATFTGVGAALFMFADAPFMGTIFALFGIFILGHGLYSLGNSLHVSRDGGTITARRSWLGLPLARRSIDLMSVQHFRVDQTMSSSSGTRHTVYYAIKLVGDGDTVIAVADGLRGRHEVDAMVRQLTQQLRLSAIPVEYRKPLRLRARKEASGD